MTGMIFAYGNQRHLWGTVLGWKWR